MAEFQQGGVRMVLGEADRDAAGAVRVDGAEVPGDPQQPAHRLTQVDRGRVGELQHHGRLRLDEPLHRCVVGEQQDRGSVGVHVVRPGVCDR